MSIRVLMITLCMASALRAQTTGCLPSDAMALDLRSFARQLAVSTDAVDIRRRTQAGFTSTDTTKIVVESVAKSCTTVVSGVNTAMKTPGQARLMYVVRFNTQGFLALQPSSPSSTPRGEYTALFALSKTGVYKTAFVF